MPQAMRSLMEQSREETGRQIAVAYEFIHLVEKYCEEQISACC